MWSWSRPLGPTCHGHYITKCPIIRWLYSVECYIRIMQTNCIIILFFSSVRARWAFLEKLSGYSRDAGNVFESAVTVAIGCFYIAILFFFQSLWEYHAMMSGMGITGEYCVTLSVFSGAMRSVYMFVQ